MPTDSEFAPVTCLLIFILMFLSFPFSIFVLLIWAFFCMCLISCVFPQHSAAWKTSTSWEFINPALPFTIWEGPLSHTKPCFISITRQLTSLLCLPFRCVLEPTKIVLSGTHFVKCIELGEYCYCKEKILWSLNIGKFSYFPVLPDWLGNMNAFSVSVGRLGFLPNLRILYKQSLLNLC